MGGAFRDAGFTRGVGRRLIKWGMFSVWWRPTHADVRTHTHTHTHTRTHSHTQIYTVIDSAVWCWMGGLLTHTVVFGKAKRDPVTHAVWCDTHTREQRGAAIVDEAFFPSTDTTVWSARQTIRWLHTHTVLHSIIHTWMYSSFLSLSHTIQTSVVPQI